MGKDGGSPIRRWGASASCVCVCGNRPHVALVPDPHLARPVGSSAYPPALGKASQKAGAPTNRDSGEAPLFCGCKQRRFMALDAAALARRGERRAGVKHGLVFRVYLTVICSIEKRVEECVEDFKNQVTAGSIYPALIFGSLG